MFIIHKTVVGFGVWLSVFAFSGFDIPQSWQQASQGKVLMERLVEVGT